MSGRRRRKPSAALRSRLESAKARDWRNKHFKRQGGACAYCGSQMCLDRENARNFATLDHIVPRSAGGAHHWENTVAACRLCNEAKGDMSAEAFLRALQQEDRR